MDSGSSNFRTTQIIESLLAKPTKKPDFKNFKHSDVLKRAQQFMPMFIQTTDRLLSDPELLKQNQMDIKVIDKDQELVFNDEADQDQQQDDKTILMDIGVGVYDVQNENYDARQFIPSSTRPIVKFNGLVENEVEGSSSEDESEDSNLFYEFNSDSDDGAASSTTKATKMEQQQSRPMIVDITPMQTNKELKKSLKAKKNSKKRQRRQ